MDFNFEEYLLGKLINIRDELAEDDIANAFHFDDLDIQIANEQIFAKMERFTPNTIYVVIKYLASDIQFGAETTPIQLIIISEENSVEKAQLIFNKFTTENNWQVVNDGTTFVKQQYNSPVVLNNFIQVTYGYRSSLYVSGTLYVMDNVVDVKDLYIDGTEITNMMTFNIAYSMTPNTQQLATDNISSSIKSMSSISISLSVPMISSTFITKVNNILKGTNTGNEDFKFNFKLGTDWFVTPGTNDNPHNIGMNFKLISATIITAINQVPSIQLGFLR